MKRDCVCPRARHEHGTTAAYTTCGCRCLHCRVVYDAAVVARRAGHVSPRTETWIPRDGTRRRIEALHAVGWSGGQLAALLDTTFQNVHDYRTKPGPIYPGTAARIADLYERIWDQAPGGHVTKTRRWAARKGFLPPMAWNDIDDPAEDPTSHACSTAPVVDEVAVERRIAGHLEPLNRHELAAAVLLLHGQGWSVTAIARRLRMSGARVGQIIERSEEEAA